MCVQGGAQRPDCEIGVYATDEDAYKQFGDLFGPVIKDLHPKFDFRYSYPFEDLNMELINEKLSEMQDSIEKIRNYKLSARRNFKNIKENQMVTHSQPFTGY